MPIRWVVPQRRINFLKHILSRKETELLRKIFEAQKQHPTQGDFVRLVESDLKKLGLSYEQVSSENVSKPMLKKMLKENAQTAAFGELFEQLQRSTKTRTIKYNRLELQGYLRSTPDTDVMNTITAVRSKCLRGIKANFPNMYKMCQHCPLNCNSEEPQEDTQEHILCTVLGRRSNVDIEFMHAESVDQRKLGEEISIRMTKRAQILEDRPASSACCRLPGALPDRSTTQEGGAAAVHTMYS